MRRFFAFLGFWLALALSGEAFAAKLMPPPVFQVINATGPLSGGKVYFYEAGSSSTLKDTYTDATGATLNTNPVILDSAGRASIWLVGRYHVMVYTSADALVYEQDQVEGDTSGIGSTDLQELTPSFCTDTSAAANALACTFSPTITTLTDGMFLRVKAANGNTGATTFAVDGITAKAVKKKYNQALGSGDIVAGQIISLVYDATQGCFQLVGSGASASDADTLDGQHGAYYLSATNLASGTVPNARLPNRIAAYHFTGSTGACTSYNALAGSVCAKTGTGAYTLTITADLFAHCHGSTALTTSTVTNISVGKYTAAVFEIYTLQAGIAADTDFNLVCFTTP